VLRARKSVKKHRRCIVLSSLQVRCLPHIYYIWFPTPLSHILQLLYLRLLLLPPPVIYVDWESLTLMAAIQPIQRIKQDAGESGRMLASLRSDSCCSHYAAYVRTCLCNQASLKDMDEILNHNRWAALNQSKAAPFALCRNVCRTHSGLSSMTAPSFQEPYSRISLLI